MVAYKGVDVDESLVSLIRLMGKVEEYRESLQTLQSVWDNLTLLGHLSGTATDMSDTRQAFEQLSGSLLNQLGRETLKKTALAMKSKAQVAVDIMIRNLFERTADIGFLAMDDEVRDYLEKFAPLNTRDSVEQSGAALQQADAGLRARFAEYVQKYSVYSDIILLDVDGNVLLQLDGSSHVRHSTDPLIEQSLTTPRAYVETFRHSDLLPGQGDSLIYSYRVSSSDGQKKLGVLCLVFRFINETEGIFANLVKEQDWSVVTLLDRRGTVIASSDQHHIAIGAKLDFELNCDWKVVRFAGRQYLSATRATQGYQGYMGPCWYGNVMLPLEYAFDHESARLLEEIPANALEAVMSNPQLFSAALRDIPGQAGRIQRALNRSVWNGNVSQHSDKKALNPAFSKILLWEISNTGLKTQDVFECSISNLHQTVVSSILQDSQFQAALAIDIMDRNLYERANDCRWWALSSVFRNALSGSAPDLRAVEQMLVHINGLYTVYDNLVVFDRNGRVLAVSNPQYRECCGQVLNEDWVRQTLNGSSSYAVSAFATSSLYKGRHTYIYAAAIFDFSPAHGIVGGIGIVFDAAPQFKAMLMDALPRDEKGIIPAGCFAVFADRDRRVIAATSPDLKPGSSIDLENSFFVQGNGEGKSAIAVFNSYYYAVAACTSKGYREYKGATDAYRNDVVALIFSPLGDKPLHERRITSAPRGRLQDGGIKSGGGESMEIATFYVDSHWLGIPSVHVVEAIDATGLTSVSGTSESMLGYIMYRDRLISVVGLWGLLGRADKRRICHEPQIIVLRMGNDDGVLLGVMVDELGEIPEIPLDRIEKVPAMMSGDNLLAESLVKPHKVASEMIVVLSQDRLRRKFMRADA
ncbi:MAG: chemotaxis protein CheW [Gallionella sp.]|jgi:chemotaxis signal transduction protein